MNIGTDARGKPKRRPHMSLVEFKDALKRASSGPIRPRLSNVLLARVGDHSIRPRKAENGLRILLSVQVVRGQALSIQIPSNVLG
jgi:hypothetical protein